MFRRFFNSFTSGEIAPRLQARSDLEQYSKGLSTLKNFLILPFGGATKRQGTAYVSETAAPTSSNVRLVPFIFNTTDAYILEFTDLKMRVFRSGAPVYEAAKNITAMTTANPGVFTSAGHGFSNNDTVYVDGLVGPTTLNARTYLIANSAANTFTLKDLYGNAIDTSSLTAYSSGGTVKRVFTLTTTIAGSKLGDIQYRQSGDILFIAHPDLAPLRIKRTSRTDHTAWSTDVIPFTDGPYYDETDTFYGGTGSNITFTPGATTGATTLTASAAIFTTTDVGRHVRFRSVNTAAWGWANITSYTSSTIVNITIERAFDATTGSKLWRLGLFSATTGYPRAIAFHEQRLWLAGTSDQPQVVTGSQSGNIYEFSPDDKDHKDNTDDTTGVVFNIADTQANQINWLVSHKVLYIGTSISILTAQGSSQGTAITSSSINIKILDKTGSHKSSPEVIKNNLVFISQFQEKFFELSYSLQLDSYQANNISILSEHLLRNQAKEISRQESPYNIIWIACVDGGLRGITYNSEQRITGWHRHDIGGSGLVLSVATIPGTTSNDTYFAVQRTINAQTKTYIEKLSPTFIETTQSSAIFSDSAVTSTGQTISGLHHLEGKTVSVLADGAVLPSATVALGSITLDKSYTVVQVGLPYTSEFRTNFLEVASSSSRGSKAKITTAYLQLYETLGGKIGFSSSSTLDPLIYRTSADLMNHAPAMFTGLKRVEFPKGFTDEGIYMYLLSDQPLPFTLLGMNLDGSI